MTTVSTLSVVIDGDSSSLLKALASSSAATKLFASSSAVPLAAAGAAIAGVGAIAVGMALDFEESFTRISALSNSSAEDIERWKGEVLDLAGETARAPKELADALFFLSSAGLEAAEIMPALEVSAKAAAVGLGETEEVANIVASALNAYADSGLAAADVTDTLVAAVREGRAEPEEFAGALGRILPIASQAGVSFDDVTASLAALSNIGLDVNEGVTAMRGTLQAIVAPGSQAADALASIGLTAQDMLDAIDERGLFGALQMLDQAARANTDTQADYIGVLRQVVPNVRALTGVLGLTGQEAEKVDAIFNNVSDATGSLSEAMGEVEESAGFKLQQALTEITAALTELGGFALPLVAEGASAVSTSINLLQGEIDAITPDFVGLLGDMLRLVPVTEGLGKAIGDAAQIYGDHSDAVSASEAAQQEWIGATIQATRTRITEFMKGAAVAAGLLADETGKARTAADRHADALREEATAALEARSAQLELAGGVLGLIEAARTFTTAQDRVNRLEAAGRTETKAYADAVNDLLSERISLESSVISLGESLAEEGRSVADARDELREMGERAGLSKEALKDFIAAGLKPVREEVQGLASDLNGIPKNVNTNVGVNVNRGALDTLVSDIEGYAARHYMIGVDVHTEPTSPWPDEALKLHLVDPMKRMGFKRKGDGWELPLAVGVHTEVTREVLADYQSGAVDNAMRQRRHPRMHGGRTPAVAHVPVGGGRGPRLDIHLDRRRFSDELSYDAAYRGW